jgi:broad specificity phosphatase PhoE
LTQAQASAEFVRAEFDPEAVWSSDLMRCVQTAEPLGLPFNTSVDLREISYGEWEGKTFAELTPEEQQLGLKKGAWDPDFSAPGGEKYSDLIARGKRFIADSKIFSWAGEVVVVGHGAAMRGLLVALLGLPAEAFGKFQIDNASVSVVDVDGDLSSVAALNITHHLRHLG